MIESFALRFGRFLNFMPMGIKVESLPNNLTERRQVCFGLFPTFRTNVLEIDSPAMEDKTHQWVAYRLRFGRFLNFTTTVVKIDSLPNNPAERRFRSLPCRMQDTRPSVHLWTLAIRPSVHLWTLATHAPAARWRLARGSRLGSPSLHLAGLLGGRAGRAIHVPFRNRARQPTD
jgi:hypothetical protein